MIIYFFPIAIIGQPEDILHVLLLFEIINRSSLRMEHKNLEYVFVMSVARKTKARAVSLANHNTS